MTPQDSTARPEARHTRPAAATAAPEAVAHIGRRLLAAAGLALCGIAISAAAAHADTEHSSGPKPTVASGSPSSTSAASTSAASTGATPPATRESPKTRSRTTDTLRAVVASPLIHRLTEQDARVLSPRSDRSGTKQHLADARGNDAAAAGQTRPTEARHSGAAAPEHQRSASAPAVESEATSAKEIGATKWVNPTPLRELSPAAYVPVVSEIVTTADRGLTEAGTTTRRLATRADDIVDPALSKVASLTEDALAPVAELVPITEPVVDTVTDATSDLLGSSTTAPPSTDDTTRGPADAARSLSRPVRSVGAVAPALLRPRTPDTPAPAPATSWAGLIRGAGANAVPGAGDGSDDHNPTAPTGRGNGAVPPPHPLDSTPRSASMHDLGNADITPGAMDELSSVVLRTATGWPLPTSPTLERDNTPD